MKIKDILNERQMKNFRSDALPAGKYYPTMPSSDPYQAYRFGLAMADHTMDYAEGPAAQNAVVFAYTPEEEEIIKGGERQTGHKGKTLTAGGSKETSDTNKTSPVAKKKKNKYGV